MPRIQRIEKTVYKFEELLEDTQRKAIENLYDLNVDYEWWDSVYEDADRAGIKLTSFDLGRAQNIDGELITSLSESIKAILNEHGKDCETYKTAAGYQDELDKIETALRLEGIDEDEADKQREELEAQYLKDILQDYYYMLKREYEYQTSEEAIRESIEANEYEFDEDGNLA